MTKDGNTSLLSKRSKEDERKKERNRLKMNERQKHKKKERKGSGLAIGMPDAQGAIALSSIRLPLLIIKC